MSEMSRISFIIPTYNNGNLLDRCVKSIENQFTDTNDNYEIIIVNDGSTDNTAEVIRTLVCQNEHIKSIEKPNGGVSAARNDGLKIAEGKYVYFVDADDFLFPDTVVNQLDIMDRLRLDTLKIGCKCLNSWHNVDNQPFTSPRKESRQHSTTDGYRSCVCRENRFRLAHC